MVSIFPPLFWKNKWDFILSRVRKVSCQTEQNISILKISKIDKGEL